MIQPKFLLVALGLSLGIIACSADNKNGHTKSAEDSLQVQNDSDLPLDQLHLPDGFRIHVFARVDNARSLARGANGTIFVGNRSEDKVYALRDEDGDGRADKKYVIASGLHMPNGVAYRNGDLYVAEVSKIWSFPAIEQHLENPPKPELIYDQYPTDDWHGWKYIAFGPDGKLYVPVGAPCNVCEPEKPVYASITRMNPDGTNMEIYAKGIRNTVGFDWQPGTNVLYFTDNGRDNLGDNKPSDELNHAPQAGMNFGFPYCHQGDIPDSNFGSKHDCSEFTPPDVKLGPHVAALGVAFYTGSQFPAAYKNQLFVAEHGSWNRSDKIGYRVALVQFDANHKATGDKVFIDGWLNEAQQKAWGRPVDVLQLPDGSILISDDFSGTVYQVTYEG